MKLVLVALTSLIGLVAFLAGSLFITKLDKDRSYKFDLKNFSFQAGVSQNSPISKCKERQKSIEAEMSSKDLELTLLSHRLSEKQTSVDTMRAFYLAQGIAQVSNAHEQEAYDFLHDDTSTMVMVHFGVRKVDVHQSKIEEPEQPRHVTSSYLLSDNIRELEVLRDDYSRQEILKAQILARHDQISHECFDANVKH